MSESGQEAIDQNLSGKLSQQIDIIHEVLGEIDKAAKRVAEKTIGYGDPPSDKEKEAATDCNPGVLSVSYARLKDAEKKARRTLNILLQTDSQL